MAKKNKVLSVEKRALARVTESEKQSWWSISFIWIGILICIPSLMIGGTLADGLTISQVVIATVISYSLIGGLMTLTGIIGGDLGLPSAMCATKTFGDSGASYVISVISFVSSIGWFGVQTADLCCSIQYDDAYFRNRISTVGRMHFVGRNYAGNLCNRVFFHENTQLCSSAFSGNYLRIWCDTWY